MKIKSLQYDAGMGVMTRELGTAYIPGHPELAYVSEIARVEHGYVVRSDRGGVEFIAAHYVVPGSIQYV